MHVLLLAGWLAWAASAQADGSPLREPSGLAATPLRSAAGAPLVLAVDDEVPRVWLLIGRGPAGVEKHSSFPLKTPVEDLEAVAFDDRPGVGRLYAVTSHRRQDEPAEMVIVRRALASEAREEVLRLPPARLAQALRDAGVAVEASQGERLFLDGRPWWKKRGEKKHPYALEIEAAACVDGELLLGIKHPLGPGGRALLLGVQVDAPFATAALRVLAVDLGGYGATAMAFDRDADELLIVSNPAVKPGVGGATAADAYGRSMLRRFRRTADGLQPVGTPRMLGRADAKLEGLAIVDDELWLAYDGDRPALVRIAR